MRFQLLVAANSLGIVRRELEQEEANVRSEWRMLDGLLGPQSEPGLLSELAPALRNRNGELCAQIRAGEFDAPEREAALLAYLEREVTSRVRISAPNEVA